MILTRRHALATGLGFSASTLLGFPTLAANGDSYELAALLAPEGIADHPMGPADAKVTVIEYSSPTCPHCTFWHANVFPLIKRDYIDTGKIQFIARPFVRNVLDAVVYLVAESTPSDSQYHSVVDAYFKSSEQWASSATPRDAMLEIAVQMGFTEESFESSLTNQDLFAGMETLRDQARNSFDVTGTPSFFVNGKMFEGQQSIESLSAAIDPLLG